MAKRARGSSSRPGQRAPLQRGTTTARPSASPATPAPKPATLTAEEEARAAALEAQIVADEKAAEDAGRRARERGRKAADGEIVARPGSIAVRASQEYAYVARDVRRIVTIGGSLVVLLVALWVVITVTGIGPF
jgi:hypothetical protein